MKTLVICNLNDGYIMASVTSENITDDYGVLVEELPENAVPERVDMDTEEGPKIIYHIQEGPTEEELAEAAERNAERQRMEEEAASLEAEAARIEGEYAFLKEYAAKLEAENEKIEEESARLEKEAERIAAAEELLARKEAEREAKIEAERLEKEEAGRKAQEELEAAREEEKRKHKEFISGIIAQTEAGENLRDVISRMEISNLEKWELEREVKEAVRNGI